MKKFKPTMISKMTDLTDLNQMLRSLTSTKAFKIDKSEGAGTVVVTHKQSGTEVLRALQNKKVWIVRLADNLFSHTPQT